MVIRRHRYVHRQNNSAMFPPFENGRKSLDGRRNSYETNWLLSASSSNCLTSSADFTCFRNRQNVSSRS